MRRYVHISPGATGYIPARIRGEQIACRQKDPEGYVCTRERGHEGLHAAHGVTGIVLVCWNDDRTTD